jgi:hypothetical protein
MTASLSRGHTLAEPLTMAAVTDRTAAESTDTSTDFAAERAIIAAFDPGDPAISLDQYDDATEALHEAGLL